MAMLQVGFLSFASFFLHIVAFILLLLVTLSGVAIKSLYLFILPYVPSTVEAISSELRFGVLGFCDSNILGRNDCFGPQLGYHIPPDIVLRDTLPVRVIGMLDHPLLSALVFHPISASLALVGSVFSLLVANHPLSIVALSLAIWTAISSTIAFTLDVVLVSVAKSRVDKGTLIVFWGAAPWMTLVAAICIWISVVLLLMKVCNCCGKRSK